MARGKDLQQREIERLLQDLGSELAVRGVPSVQVLIVEGGDRKNLSASQSRNDVRGFFILKDSRERINGQQRFYEAH